MSEIKILEDRLRVASVGYETSAQNKAALKEMTMVLLLGPFATGKTAIMDTAGTIDGSFHRVDSMTTRPRRPDEDPHPKFRAHDEQTLRALLLEVEAGSLVQFMVHPTTAHVYGSAIDSYGAYEFPMLEAVPAALPGLDALPFRDSKKITVVAPSGEWLGRLSNRRKAGSEADIKKRVAEGVTNLAWAFDQGENHLWVSNGSQPIVETAAQVIGIVRGEHDFDMQARVVGDQLWSELRRLQAEL
jgi:hypothetical protein